MARVAQTASISAPTGGWNARDAYGEMPETDAITLQNFYPTPSDVMHRKGYTQYSTGLGAQVESLPVYSSPTAQYLFGCAGSNVYNCTSGGAVGAAVLTGLTNARWQHQNISTAGGNFMLMVNGADKLRGYNGTTWWTDGDATHDITGFDTSKAANIMLHMNRIWLTEAGSLRCWYLPVSSIAGAANALDFSSVARKGGYLVGMNSWTIDAGAGMNNYAAFFTSNGEIIVYSGTDPANANTWSLTGVWALGAPLGRRCSMKWGGDLLLITLDGILPMASSLQSSRLDPRVAISDKIYNAISNATTTYQSNFGWDMLYYAKANMLIINVPVAVGQQQQYVMNTITKAWCNFTNWPANCWALYNDEPYFGGNGVVCRAWNGFADNATNINGLAQQAFNYMVPPPPSGGSRAVQKRFTMARPILFSNGAPAAAINLDMDYDLTAPTGSLSFTSIPSGVWDSALWDTGVWTGGLNVSKNWYGVQGIGYCASINLSVNAQGIETHWAATDLVFEAGGTL